MDERVSRRPPADLEAERKGKVPPSFVRRGVTVLGLALLGILTITIVWIAVEVFLVVFAGVLLGVFLLALRDFVVRWAPLSEGWALGMVILLLLAALTIAIAFLAPQLAEQADEFGQRIPEIVADIEGYLQQYAWGRQVLEALEDGAPMDGFAAGFMTLMGGIAGAATYFVAFLFIGLFIAINPRLYTDGMVKLMPKDRRERTRDVLGEIGNTLRWFLVARAIAMFLVGASTAIALLLLGIPMALLLGVIAGILTFVPYLGPVIAAVPILLVSLLEGPTQALYVLIAYTAIQQIEGNIFDPLILQRVVHLPPAVTVTSQILGSALLGFLGLALATPFAAVMQVIVRRVYREDVLGDEPEDEEDENGESDDEDRD